MINLGTFFKIVKPLIYIVNYYLCVHAPLVCMVANNMHACLLLLSLFLFIYIMVVAELDGLRAYKGTLLWYFSFTTAQNIFTVCSKEGLAQWGEKWRMV